MRSFVSVGAGLATVLFATGVGLWSSAALAASAVQKECSAKYQAAKAANTLNGQTYNQFYKACAAEAKSGGAGAAPAAAAAPSTSAPAAAAAPPTTPPATTATAGGAAMPTAISASFAKETPHLARLHTCAEQWKLNKANNATAGLKWPKYYSECNARLKG